MRLTLVLLLTAALAPAADQITRANVTRLQAVWTYHTGALQPQTELNERAAFEATPILEEEEEPATSAV